MVSLKVVKVEKIDIQAENETKLDITIELSEDGQVLEERKLNFPLETSKEAIKEELQKFLDTYNLERVQMAENAARDAAHAQADEAIEELTGLELGSTEQPEAPAEPVAPESANPEVVESVGEIVNETPSEEVTPESQPTQ